MSAKVSARKPSAGDLLERRACVDGGTVLLDLATWSRGCRCDVKGW